MTTAVAKIDFASLSVGQRVHYNELATWKHEPGYGIVVGYKYRPSFGGEYLVLVKWELSGLTHMIHPDWLESENPSST